MINREKRKNSEKNLVHCHFVHDYVFSKSTENEPRCLLEGACVLHLTLSSTFVGSVVDSSLQFTVPDTDFLLMFSNF
jgi:hypothetical protein